jgi:phosphatidylinositol alpha-1,6-mannosyltransferase
MSRNDKRWDVVLISSEFPPGPGGIGTHTYHIAHCLHRLGLLVGVLCPKRGDAGKVRDFDRKLPFPVIRFQARLKSWFSSIPRTVLAIKACLKWKPACLIASGRSGVLITHPVASLLGIPWVAIGHGGEFSMSDWVTRKAFHSAFRRADRFIAVSRFTQNLMLKIEVQPEKITVIPNGADADLFKPMSNCDALRRRLGILGKNVILTVGSVTERKAQDNVIRALPRVLKAKPDTVYLSVGSPLEAPEFSALAERLGVSEHVRFLGTVPSSELPSYYALSDVFILCSRIDSRGDNEGFGIALIEAGLMGKPVVGTRGCGIEDAIVDGKTGLLIDMDSPDQAADALIQVLSDKDLAKRLGDSGRQRALTDLTWERCAKRYKQILENYIRPTNSNFDC